jgi:ribosomal protein S18 acetylase RimI-like enzyme
MVWPLHQGLGFGNAMLSLTEQVARAYAKPLIAVTLRVHKNNKRAHALYTRRGFKPLAPKQRQKLARKYPGFDFLQCLLR